MKFLGWVLLLRGHHGKVFTSAIVLFPALLKKSKQAELFRALFWLFPHHVQDIHVLSLLRDLDGLIPKSSCGVKLKIFSCGLIPTPVPHRADAQGHAVFRGLLSEQMCNAMKLWNVLKTYGRGFPDHVFLSKKWHFPWLKSWQSTHSVNTGQKSVV